VLRFNGGLRQWARVNGVDFSDLGADYFDRMNSAELKRYHPRRRRTRLRRQRTCRLR